MNTNFLDFKLKKEKNNSIPLVHFYNLNSLIDAIDSLENYSNYTKELSLNLDNSANTALVLDSISGLENNVSNCLALTIKKDYKLISLTNIINKSLKILAKTTGIGLLLTAIKIFL